MLRADMHEYIFTLQPEDGSNHILICFTDLLNKCIADPNQYIPIDEIVNIVNKMQN